MSDSIDDLAAASRKIDEARDDLIAIGEPDDVAGGHSARLEATRSLADALEAYGDYLGAWSDCPDVNDLGYSYATESEVDAADSSARASNRAATEFVVSVGTWSRKLVDARHLLAEADIELPSELSPIHPGRLFRLTVDRSLSFCEFKPR